MARIFIIDDDEQLLRMVGLMLERGGHTITLINNPLDGLEQIKADAPDLLVLDVMMPNMSGHDLARAIRSDANIENLPILVLTARSQEVDRTTALKSGADDYLSKPVTSQELMERIDTLLAKKSGQSSPKTGIIITAFGLRGGVGQTTLAVNLAAALRRTSQQEVCLVDLSSSGGQAVMHMRLQARASWLDLPDENELDWSVLKNRLIIHPSGLRVLAAPAKPQDPSVISGERMAHILNLLKHHVAFTVVDAPRAYSPAFLHAVTMADMGLHIITPEVVAVQTAVQLNRRLDKAGIQVKRKSHILNQHTPEAQLLQAAVERGLNTKVAFQIGFDANQARAIAQGVPLTLTSAKSGLPNVVRRMSEAIWQRVSSKSL
ncbi:MAG: response regulator/pilus assembly protein [Chloroflexi bacterium]|nr:response regulator/pilus assembly protein [Chloroflexota bacterium]